MNKKILRKVLLVVFAAIMLFSVTVNIKLLSDRSKGYDAVRCVDCFKRTNHLFDTGQSLGPSEDTYLTGETVAELMPQIEQAFPWMCENCLNDRAERFAVVSE